MKKIKVELGKRSYDILIGNNIIWQLKKQLKRMQLGRAAIIVTNHTINSLYGTLMRRAMQGLNAQLYFEEVPDSEESKSTEQGIRLIEKFASLDKGRGVFVIAFGGGVIGDLAGFAASVYRRGIPYIQVPTTLLAQVDSSIGGKVAIDLSCGKNLIGSFYQPRLVLSDLNFLKSLPEEQIKEAMAEIIKYAIITRQTLFEYLERNLEDIFALKQTKLRYIVETCSRIKAEIVQLDERDKLGKRMLLNFGHTAGHALEAAAGYLPDYTHGKAVAIGILVCCEIAKQLKMLSDKARQRIERMIKKAGLPTEINDLEIKNILKALAHDKKFSGGKNRFILPKAIGRVVIKESVPQRLIARAISSRISAQSSSLGDYE